MEEVLGVIAGAGMVAILLGISLTPVAVILEEAGQKPRADKVGYLGIGLLLGGLCLAVVAAIIVLIL